MPNRKRKNILNEGNKNRIPGKSGGGRAKGLERFDELRMNAERELKENPDAHIEMRIGEASELIHEIRVYQIELEMQNEELRSSQSRLEELSEKYIDLYDFAPIGYMTLDETGAILEINLTGALMMGAPRKTLIKTPFRRHIARESQDTFHFHFREVLGSVANKTCELNIKRLDGSIFSAKLNSQSPPYATTGTQQIRVAMIDISNTKEMEDSLRVSEESFRALTENSGDMIMRFDHDLRHTYVNPSVVNQIDKKPEDLLGKNWREAGIPEELGRSWDRALRSVFKTGKPTAMETAIDAKHRRVVLDWRFFPEFDKSGKVETVIGTAHDITLKKELADALKESEERFSIAFSLNPAPTLITTIDEGRITNVNDVWLKTMGYSPEEVLGRTTIELSLWETPDDRNRYIKLLNEKGSVENELFRLRTESGEMRDILLSAQPVLINGEGMLLSVCYDITERKKIEEALRDSEERYRNLFEENHSSMLLVDPEDGSIVDANPAACSFYRYSREEITRMNVADINMLARDELFREMERANSEKRKVFVFRHRLADGEIRDVDVYSGPIKLHGRPLLLSTIHDITERKRSESEIMRLTEELRESNKELEAFTYSVSHDLRAPIRIMKGYARMVMKEFGIITGTELQRRLMVIQDSAIKMGELVEALLNLSRIGRTALSLTNLEMKNLIEDAWNEIRTLNPGRNIEFDLKDLPPAVGDCNLVRQVVYNLLSNSVKYTKNRQTAVIEVGGYVEGEQSIFFVRDNGAGFDMRYYDKLFGVFQRLHGENEYEGTGVGLSIVQRVVTRHGGRAWAEGKVEEGATFYFSLPSENKHLSRSNV